MKLAIGITVCRDLEGNVRVVFVIDLSFVAGGYHAVGSVDAAGRICVKVNRGKTIISDMHKKELLVQCQEYNSPVPLRHQVSIDGKV